MKTGICTLPLIPLRSEPSERSEMISQILFGELVEIQEESDSWSKIRTLADNYTGWCTTKMLQSLPHSMFEKLEKMVPYLTKALLTPCTKIGETYPQLFLPAGSRLYFLDQVKATFPVFKSNAADFSDLETVYWNIPVDSAFSSLSNISKSELVQIATLFMNAPYLWGGKSILGIDCSGLVQVVFSLFGKFLPRDARDQALVGEAISELSNARAGDLAFFNNAEGKIVHVGMLVDNGRIIHSSGFVHIDTLDAKGIFSDDLGKYTHELHSIKRYFPSLKD